ncbi:sensor histidine kinase [Tsukamurella sp. 8F]|uniref:sensor histidine kinase n=1 Tax=unclassified Tsukamurella TaxID=2633480 RepID=UPI0023BA0FE1|nr:MULTISPECIES: sensor histidine kinase [unclassified Tsukamurella]MDF0529947.1 sensor histidine kinase [Tsukamurella sp. 8J]MDF0587281.1 sensor histidine kinase [Tsukamurella sp. 8F]
MADRVSLSLWDAYVLGGCAAAVAGVWMLDDRFPGTPWAATGAITAIAVCATVFRDGRSQAAVVRGGYAAVIVVLFGIAVFFAGPSVAAMLVMYPVLFRALPVRPAVAATTVVNVIPTAIALFWAGVHSEKFVIAATITVLALVSSPIIGIAVVTVNRHNDEQAALLAELETSRADAARMSRAAGAAAERERLAREIHDTLAQGFTSIVALAQAISAEMDAAPDKARRHVDLIGDTARENLAEARAMVTVLTPAALTTASVSDAVERLATRLADETGVSVTVVRPPQAAESTTAHEVVLLRVAQEAFANIRKHAHASSVTVTLSSEDGQVCMSVADDGVGFDCAADDLGFGLGNMRARIEGVGGGLAVSSGPGAGTTVDVRVPS